MSRVYVLSEGPTEQALILDVLAPPLSKHSIYLIPKLLGAPGHKGGIRRFAAVEREISNLLRQESAVYVTTLFDRYGLPGDWPGLAESKAARDINAAHRALCQAMGERIEEIMGSEFRAERFIPHIQFYEIEAFLFVSPSETARILGDPSKSKILRQIRDGHETCEHINDGVNTAPSKRITSIFPSYSYKKGRTLNAHLWRVCAEIGVPELRKSCRLFDGWISKLEALGPA